MPVNVVWFGSPAPSTSGSVAEAKQVPPTNTSSLGAAPTAETTFWTVVPAVWAHVRAPCPVERVRYKSSPFEEKLTGAEESGANVIAPL